MLGGGGAARGAGGGGAGRRVATLRASDGRRRLGDGDAPDARERARVPDVFDDADVRRGERQEGDGEASFTRAAALEQEHARGHDDGDDEHRERVARQRGREHDDTKCPKPIRASAETRARRRVARCRANGAPEVQSSHGDTRVDFESIRFAPRAVVMPLERWRVTYTEDRAKKRATRRDGALELDRERGIATLFALDASAGDARWTRIVVERVRDVDAYERGSDVALGERRGVYLDEREDGGGGGGGGEAGEGGARGHRFVNAAFRKKFVPPMRAVQAGGVGVRGGGREDAVRRVGVEGGVNEPVSDLARLLAAHDGNLDDALERFARAEGGGGAGPSERASSVVALKSKPLAVVPVRARVTDDAPKEAKKRAPPPPRVAQRAASLSTEVCVKFPSSDYIGSTFAAKKTFGTTHEYQAHFVTAMCENLTLRLRDVSNAMQKLRDETNQSNRKIDPSLVQKIMWQRYKLRYFTDCELTSRKYFNKDEGKEDTFVTLQVNDFKAIKGPKPYAKGDFWIVSTDPAFEVKPLQEIGDRFRAPWIGVLECVWHGMDQNGKMEVRLKGPRPASLRDNSTLRLFAIHSSLNAFSETEEISNVLKLSETDVSPLIDCVLGKFPPEELAEEQELYLSSADIGVMALQRRFKLNDDQARAVSGALASATSLSQLPIRLVHGPFGSGKTHTIAAFIIKASEMLKSSNGRIMISAHTNVAVDRVLQKLLELGFTDFVRVGSVRKIDPTILPYSVHAKTGRMDGDSQVKELEAMLKETTSARARAILQHEIASLKGGKLLTARRQLMKKCSVIGVTTYSSTHKYLDGKEFAVVVLDECSQMTEPSSLLPIARTKCKTLVAVGDPQQLYPVVECFPEDGENASSRVTRNPLKKTLFSRLTDAGYPKLTLRTQYRLHPVISAIPNKCFYEGMLMDGVDVSQRSSLIKVASGGVLPPIVWWDTSGFDEREGQSKVNTAEGQRVRCVVRCLLDNGISANNVGVIAFYAAQASYVSKLLDVTPGQASDEMKEPSFSPSDVQVSTVDAFQGQEKEVIVFTLCGAPMSSFITAERLNVAITRAKRHLIVIGDASVAQKSGVEAWLDLLKCARRSPNGYVPSRMQTEPVLSRWGSMTESNLEPALSDTPSFEPELSPSFVSSRQALLRLNFTQREFWYFYCAVMRAFNYEHAASRTFVTESNLIPFIRRSFPRIFSASGDVKWRSTRARRALTLDVLATLRSFIQHEYGEEWGTTKKLIEAFENREELERDPTGFGWLCLREANDDSAAVGADQWARADFVPRAAPSASSDDDFDHVDNDLDDDDFDDLDDDVVDNDTRNTVFDRELDENSNLFD